MADPKWFSRVFGLWPPFLGAGIKVDYISEDYSEIQVSLRLSRGNANYVGTHFGGSLYAMTDPFYMLMVMKRIGNGYVVWDRAAEIEFLRPGRGTVRAVFRLSEADVQEIKDLVDAQEKKKILWSREVVIVDQNNELVARVNKTLYIRDKKSLQKYQNPDKKYKSLESA